MRKKWLSAVLSVFLASTALPAAPQKAAAIGETVTVHFTDNTASTYKLSKQPDLTIQSPNGASMTTISIDPTVTYQTFMGMGTSFDQAAMYHMFRMSSSKRNEVMKKLFDPNEGSSSIRYSSSAWNAAFGSRSSGINTR